MFVLRKIWRALFSCYLRFEICHFALLATVSEAVDNKASLRKLT